MEAELANMNKKLDAQNHAKEGRARARQDKDRAVARELELDSIADKPFGAGGFGSVFMAK